MFVGTMAVSASVYSQKTRIDLQLMNSTVGTILKSIEGSSEFIFIYDTELVNTRIEKSISIRGANIETILDELFSDSNIAYYVDDRQVFLYKKDDIKQLERLKSAPVVTVIQQQKKDISGSVKDQGGLPLPGVSVVVKGTTTGTVTDPNGLFKLAVPADAKTLVFSFVGMKLQEVAIGGKNSFNITLEEETLGVGEVVIVGYGQQKKESIVAAIAHTSGEQLAKTGATTNLSRALQGQLPGVTTIQISGEPGQEDPRILIRSQGTWNNSSPLILVDGVERSMSDINVSEVESVSVLKDASATAVFGVKGAEGVILITTKRGSIGKPQLVINANTSMKFLSRTPDKLDAYEGFLYRNDAIEYELAVSENSWPYYMPLDIVEHYKRPQSEADKYIFPNVDWRSEQLDKNASSSQVDLTVSGGSEFAKYFGAISYTHEGDLLKSGLDNGKGYNTKVAYDRFNFRSNLDFNLTKSTIFSVNLSGYVGTKWGGAEYNGGQQLTASHWVYDGFYFLSPSVMPVRWPDGSWGYNPDAPNTTNPIAYLNNIGRVRNVRTQITTDFILKQNLDFITKGLSVQGSLSYDNRFYSRGGMTDPGGTLVKYIDPDVIDKAPGETEWDYTYGSIKNPGINDYDFVRQPVNYVSENTTGKTVRRLYYLIQTNYARTFKKHDLGLTFLMNREEFTEGSEFPRYREDWVGRITYNYDTRYFFETNGAYNGSEKFSSKYRFGFFPSVALGWMVSNEQFLKKDWLDKLKLRYSYGKVGNDNTGASRWGYETNWAIDGASTVFGNSFKGSPYTQYLEANVGNPDLNWEESTKQNVGLELAVLKNMFNLNVDVYQDDRSGIFMSNTQRQIPDYFGAAAPSANLGKTRSKGYEIEFKFQRTTQSQLNYWATLSYTNAKDKVVYMEDPVLLSAYLQKKGFQIGQSTGVLGDGYLNNWDDVYSSLGKTQNKQKLPGDANLIDFNGDGKMDSYDAAPFGYPDRPQHTYTAGLGASYKGFSIMLQFYGVYNVSRTYGYYLYGFSDETKTVVFENMLDTWRPWNTDAEWSGQRLVSSGDMGTQRTVDGSYMRLKNAEIAYTFSGNLIKNMGVSSTRLYINGNNLLYWSKMMDDRETNNVTNGAAYPMFGTITFGMNVNF
ncbi:MAG: hypothetical protein A2W90_03790 [Bacteroidetes bacterium GWF2_42_66]|nr:MAG: hypothetical protein A2W92_18710 [Bacteroidetes bacterium GWA2_42_15]OFY02551.1 MAG: hypothetical protein A2W89_22060 [Bacteroidetes bacterium GWE2_42_39]OFY41350.1 MAG: hypothetical protein A2W90_03790 [Bacteroidetes bacterium GWF2_42_66]